MRKVIKTLVVGAVVFGQTGLLAAPPGPSMGVGAGLLPKDTLITSLRYVGISKDRTYDGDSKIADPQNKDVDVGIYNAIVRYAFTNDFNARIIFPYAVKNLKMHNNTTGVGGDFNSRGLGDIHVRGNYRFMSQRDGAWANWGIVFGAYLPTGKTDKNFTLNNGTTLPNHAPNSMQLGSGSFDPYLGVGFTKFMDKHRVDGDILYRLNTKGDNSYEVGDKIEYNLGYNYEYHKYFMPLVELNGVYSEKDELRGVKQNASGGNEISLGIGFNAFITKKLLFVGSYSEPIYRDLNKGALGTKGLLSLRLTYIW